MAEELPLAGPPRALLPSDTVLREAGKAPKVVEADAKPAGAPATIPVPESERAGKPAGAKVPAPAASPAPRGPLQRMVADSAAMQGRRPKQEDRHVKIPDLTKAAKALKMPIDHLDQPCSFFAVYDGHQGHLCSEFAAKGFHMKLLKKLSADTSPASWPDERLQGALADVCEELDTEFLAKFRTAPDGCTVVVALVTGVRLHVAWVGDSRCLLCRLASRGGIVPVALTEDHRPSVPSEAERVTRAGGAVVNFDGSLRVAHEGFEEKIREIRRAQAQGLGIIAKEPVALAVSRALGDRHFKAVTGRALLISKPSVRSVRLDESHKFVALMCDGIPDVMKHDEIVSELDIVRDPKDAAANVRASCGALVQEAYKRGSGDNLTVILVKFEWKGGVRATAGASPAPLADHGSAASAAVASTPRGGADDHPAGHSAPGNGTAAAGEKRPALGNGTRQGGGASNAAAAASKKRRLEAAASVKAQKVAAYERATAQEAAEEAERETAKLATPTPPGEAEQQPGSAPTPEARAAANGTNGASKEDAAVGSTAPETRTPDMAAATTPASAEVAAPAVAEAAAGAEADDEEDFFL